MTEKTPTSHGNDAFQSSETDLALGEDERAFGAGGQDPISTGAEEQRDVDRDASLDAAGVSASSKGGATGGGSGQG